MDNENELLPIVDEMGNIIGKATRKECHNGDSKLLHPIVYLHVFDKNGRMFLQKRPLWKKVEPGKWDVAVGGHIDYGENTEVALFREANEELGIINFTPTFVGNHIFESKIEREFVNVYKTIINPEDIHITDELDDGKWFTIEEIKNMIDYVTPNLLNELRYL